MTTSSHKIDATMTMVRCDRFEQAQAGPSPNTSGRSAAPDRVSAGFRSRFTAPFQLFLLQCSELALLSTCGVLDSIICCQIDGDASALKLASITVLSVGFILLLRRYVVMRAGEVGKLSHRIYATWLAVGTTAAAAVVLLMLIGMPEPVLWLWPVTWTALVGGLSTAFGVLGSRLTPAPVASFATARSVAVVGVNPYSHDLVMRFKESESEGLRFAGLYNDEHDDGPAQPLVQGGVSDLVEESRWNRIDAVVLALPVSNVDRINRVRNGLRSIAADIYLASEVFDMSCKSASVDRLASVALLKISSPPLTRRQIAQKSAIDIFVATMLLAALLPCLALIALAVKIDSPGPALFRQPRRGFNNSIFYIFKFRTMFHHMADMQADRQTVRGDPRLTRLGKILRKYSLDELPQLLNVLCGEMSLVGPRPHAPNTKAGTELFHDAVRDYGLRYRVRPGITGWAQVNGWRGQTSTREQIEQRVAHDLYYIENWSVLFDMRILALTVLGIFNTKVVF